MELPHLFERNLPEGWVYPCSLADVESVLRLLPESDLAGLWAVGMAPRAHHHDGSYAGYRWGSRCVIHVYAVPADLAWLLRAGSKPRHWSHGPDTETRFGMIRERAGSRWMCRWDREDLRRFTLEHVLLHEAGHHVCHREREAAGLVLCPGNGNCEQYAEHYAIRRRREIFGDAAGGLD